VQAGADILAEGLGADCSSRCCELIATASAITAASTAPEETAAALGLTEAGIGGAVGAGIVGAVGAGIVGVLKVRRSRKLRKWRRPGVYFGSTVAGEQRSSRKLSNRRTFRSEYC